MTWVITIVIVLLADFVLGSMAAMWARGGTRSEILHAPIDGAKMIWGMIKRTNA